MNPNDIYAQQQALLNQAMQNAHQNYLVLLAIQLAALLIGAWVLYMFYARLRDIADELRMLRIAYEMANPPAPKSRSSSASGNPFQRHPAT